MESLNPDRKNTVTFKVSCAKEERISYVEIARAINENFSARNIFCLQPRPNGNYNLTFTNVGSVFVAKEQGIRFRNEVIQVEAVNQLTTVIWIQDAPVELHHSLISRRLQEYGDVKDMDYVRIKEELGGYYNGDRKVTIILKKSIPSYLKVGKFTLRIRYRGMISTCRRCGESGHLARECKKDLLCNVCNRRGHIGDNCDLNQQLDLTEEEYQEQLESEIQDSNNPLRGKLNWAEGSEERTDIDASTRRIEDDIGATAEKEHQDTTREVTSGISQHSMRVEVEETQTREPITVRTATKKDSESRARDLHNQGSKDGPTSPPYCDAQEMFDFMFPALISGNSTSASSSMNIQPLGFQGTLGQEDYAGFAKSSKTSHNPSATRDRENTRDSQEAYAAFAKSSKTPRNPSATLDKEEIRDSATRDGSLCDGGYNNAQSRSEQDLGTVQCNSKRKLLSGKEVFLEEGEIRENVSTKDHKSRSSEMKKKRQSDN